MSVFFFQRKARVYKGEITINSVEVASLRLTVNPIETLLNS